ncbi:MAG: 16S rRNA (uracil(1498)-N(3))-methyltransferase [Legionellales bacterium]|nr:16S rRNA (uracil(1498)-N(3))-methyltransferase [Legionellales bacterium]|tara:strand:+ start:266 stop:994 length:729 start_codon:yes stop_codon:yes gene_type:complete
MRVPRIYQQGTLEVDKTYELSTSASHHLYKVLRLAVNHPIILFNGDGQNYLAEITSLGKTVFAIVKAIEKNHVESPVNIHLGQVISKGDKMEYTVQKAVELGANAITPLFSSRCNIKLNPERQLKKQTQWQMIIENACQQSGRSSVPNCHTPTNLLNWIVNIDCQLKIILDPTGSVQLKSLPQQNILSIALLVGSEGGFSQEEVNCAKTHGFTAVNLGHRILRTETASVAMLAILQAWYGDL